MPPRELFLLGRQHGMNGVSTRIHYETRIRFSNGERGKFYRPNTTLSTPVYLDKKVQSYLAERAKLKGVEIGE